MSFDKAQMSIRRMWRAIMRRARKERKGGLMKKYESRPHNSILSNSRRRRRTREEALYSFNAVLTLEELAEAQGISPVTNYDEVTSGANWPEDQSVEDFIAAATEARYEEDEPDP